MPNEKRFTENNENRALHFSAVLPEVGLLASTPATRPREKT
jgi:hypothetical protein